MIQGVEALALITGKIIALITGKIIALITGKITSLWWSVGTYLRRVWQHGSSLAISVGPLEGDPATSKFFADQCRLT